MLMRMASTVVTTAAVIQIFRLRCPSRFLSPLSLWFSGVLCLILRFRPVDRVRSLCGSILLDQSLVQRSGRHGDSTVTLGTLSKILS
jgi:hypothetical protein